MTPAGRWMAVLAVVLSSACAEKPQTIDSGRKADSRAFEGAAPAFTAEGWAKGDAASWDQQMRRRAQAQNEYLRTAP